MSGDIDRRTSSEVAHQAEDTRAHLASTLEQLRNNLKPENVMEEVVSNARIGASTVADSLAGIARQYPIPAVMMAAGSAFLLRVFAKRGGPPDVVGLKSEEGPLVDSRAPARPPMLRNPSAFTPPPGSADPSGPAAVAAGAPEARDGVTDTLLSKRSTFERQTRGAYRSTFSQAGDAMQSLSQYIPHDRHEVRSKLSHLLEEQPLILGVIGLAVGAAIGAALPMTETEDRLMGDTAQRMRDSAADAARQEVDGLRVVTGEALDNLRHSAT